MTGKPSRLTNVAIQNLLNKLLRDHNHLEDEGAANIENQTFELQWPGLPGPIEQSGPLCPSDPVERIVDGFKYFKTNYFDAHPYLFDELAQKQTPKFVVFACSDSRVCPSHILHFQPGEAFVVRNIANMVPAFDKLKYSGVGATIEYAIEELGVENILVMGHSRCGGIKRLMSYPQNDSTPFDFVDEWVKTGLPAKAKVLAKGGNTADFEQQCESCAREAVNLSLRNLQSYPYVQKALSDKRLALRGGYYDFVHGVFEIWELQSHISASIIVRSS